MRGLVRVALVAAAVAAAVTACSRPAGSHAPPVPASYYLALGDSLARGVQPNAAGVRGETTSTMINGGICRYPDGSQLADAVAFLRSHRGHVFLVTVDIGANDLEDCGSQPGLIEVIPCFVADVPGAVSRLGTIMTRLRTAAGPDGRIAGMSYYLPALAQWRDGSSGQAFAKLIERLETGYNDLLDRVYADHDAKVADVFGAFATSDFSDQVTVPGIGKVPRNVALLCRYTWECTAPPRGPNQHANATGYGVIARAFLQAAGLR